MRFPDEDAYDEAGAITRLWYKIICPFTFGARLWMVTTSILCALAVIQSANGSWGYHGRAQDTGFLSGNFVNGVRRARCSRRCGPGPRPPRRSATPSARR